jgi:dihydrofolate synthase/folylpolyglutamate synthase
MDPVAQLLARDQHGLKFGLDNIRTLCTALGEPQLACPTLLVAGTNGKGSVTAMVAAALTAAGHRTGRYTSPHLVRVEERFAIDGVPVGADVLRRAAERVLAVERESVRAGLLAGPVTFFEITTATGFEIFRHARAEVLVLEVGMGGRFDATNVAEPCCGAITSIAFDHQRFLGGTLGEIAFEKAGIVKEGRPVVLGALPPEADTVIRRVASERHARVVHALDDIDVRTVLLDDGITELSLRTPARDYPRVRLALRGRHQVPNAVVAVRLLEEAACAGVRIDAASVARGLAEVSWPARLQYVVTRDGRRILLDAAHNPAGATALADYLADIGSPPVSFVFGAMRDKDIRGMLAALAPHAARFIFARAHSHRAMPGVDLIAEARHAGISTTLVLAESPDAALDRALHEASPVVIAGSIFLIGDLLPRLEAMAGTDGDRGGAKSGR